MLGRIIKNMRISALQIRAVPSSPQGGEKMVNYELMFIIDPTLEEEKKNQTVEMVKEIITAGAGEVSDVDVWGMRKLAYPIEKKEEGFYVVLQFKAAPELPKELNRRLRISDAVIRHLIINKDAE